VSFFSDAFSWLTTSEHWSGGDGIVHRLWEHLQYSALALAIAMLIALPIGLWIGHTGRGTSVAFSLSGAARALPTLGVLVLLFKVKPLALWPAVVALVILAVPPMLANAAAGIGGVDPSIRDAAKGMGMTGWQSLRRVEVPVGLPLILAGIRSASSQVIATATIAAYGALGGLGRFILDGYSTQDYGEVYGGAVLVALFALVSEGLFALLQRVATPRLTPGRRRRADTVTASATTLAAPAPATVLSE
jgi:osmoprotectant transport system permease protein